MYALVHTLPIYSGTECSSLVDRCGLAQTWSLVVEATFYVALPLYAAAVARMTRSLSLRAWVAAQAALLAGLSAVSVALQFGVFDPAPRWLTGSVAGYVLWFSVGLGVAVGSAVWPELRWRRAARARRWPLPELAWLLATAIYVALCLALPATPFLLARSQQLAVHLGFAAIAALLVLPAVTQDGRAGVPGRVLGHPVMAWLGLVSYGIFLWHYAVALKLGFPGAGASFPVVLVGTLGISIACAAVSYYVVERPLLRLKYRRLRDVTAIAAPRVRGRSGAGGRNAQRRS
jgi:peptidoglycan/LPS O-acetylase OafA/YrhL